MYHLISCYDNSLIRNFGACKESLLYLLFYFIIFFFKDKFDSEMIKINLCLKMLPCLLDLMK